MNVKSYLSIRLAVIAFAIAFWFPVSAQSSASQQINLDAGWNLVSLQVLPTNTTPESVFAPLGEDFVAAWTYDNTSRSWTLHERSATPSAIAPIRNIEVGQAYWVYLNAPRTWTLSGRAPERVPGVVLQQGWNLVGIPAGTGDLPEPVSMLSVLAASGLDYDVILRWEAGRYTRSTPADSDVDDFTAFDPARGYWVRVNTSQFTLQPKLLSSVRADVDVEPQGNFPSFEDLEISVGDPPHLPRTPLGPTNQTHIVFLPGEDTQQLAIANTGGGILLWELDWAPQDAPEANWFVATALRGIATIENDVVRLQLDRTRLAQGTYRGRLTLRSTAGDRIFEVIAHVPGLAGEWRGSARIASARVIPGEARRNPLPDVDLHLSFFEDPTVPGLLRGVVDSRNSLLWPVDVPLVGHVLSADGNRFTLGGAYILPPGDQNNPPYDRFPDGGADVDWNCDEKLDAINPYPFPIYRSVTLQGQLEQASPTGGYVIGGTYTEMVYGMLRKPIRLDGAFSLTRQHPTPFASRQPSANAEAVDGTQPVVLRRFSSSSGQSIRSGRTTNSLSFSTDLVLHGLSVEVDLAEAPSGDVTLTLVAPDGRAVILHDRASISSLRNLAFPERRQPAEPLGRLVAGAVPAKGTWRLIVENRSTTTGRLMSWSLRLQGQPVFDLTGQVVDADSTMPIPAQVLIDGLPISGAVEAGSDGAFRFSRIPGIPLNFSASLPGFEPAHPEYPGLGPQFTVPHFDSACDSAQRRALLARFRPLPAMPVPAAATSGFGTYGSTTNPVRLTLRSETTLAEGATLLASPPMGPGPLLVRLTLVGPAGLVTPGTFLRWEFGDGTSTNTVGVRSVDHTYANSSAAGYLATVTMTTGTSLAQRITVAPSPGNTPNPLNFFQVHFTSGGTVPADLVFNITGVNDPTRPPAFADLLMVQHADAASFDIDRAPYTTETDRAFDSDGFAVGLPTRNAADFRDGFKGEDFNYHISPERWTQAAECGYAIEDDFHQLHPKAGQTGACAAPRVRVLCNLGPPILPMPDTELTEGQDGIAKARDLRLITGPLAPYWNN